MTFRSLCALTLVVTGTQLATAQTVRFDTNVGNIDIVLNPTGDPNLAGHVANMLAYIDGGNYKNVVVNRADTGADPNDPFDDFVLQLGGFNTTGGSLPDSVFDFGIVPRFDPVIVDVNGDGQVDFDTSELTNTRSTVTLALSGNPTNPNSGTSSFFVNLSDNAFLDASGFVPFAEVRDMSTVDFIMRLNQAIVPGGGLASSNIPIVGESELVILERAFVLDPNPVAAATVGDAAQASQALTHIPEPASAGTAVLALLTLAASARRRK